MDSKRFVIVDIETTGGNARMGRIIEIAAYLYEDDKVIDELVTLINPECHIPPFITNMTGITEDMVSEAPRFFEIARDLVSITDKAIFVAHNVAFDWGFIATEFRRLGYNWAPERLCTLQLSRRLLPGHKSYSLGNLCADLGIVIEGRHRAAGDALATVELFKLLLSKGLENAKDPRQLELKLHPALVADKLHALPQSTGVYYFWDEKGNLIYIGKSNNIKQRVLSHFYNRKTQKELRIQAMTADVTIEETGSELIALLLESDEIKKHKPLFNRAQRRSIMQYGVFDYTDLRGYIQFNIARTAEHTDLKALASFPTKDEAAEFLENLIDRHELCMKLCGLYPTDGACFLRQVHRCHGACEGSEEPELYNLRAQKAIDELSFHKESFLLLEPGRHDDENAFVFIDNGIYRGFGYVPNDVSMLHPAELSQYLVCTKENHDVYQIILRYMRQKKVRKQPF